MTDIRPGRAIELDDSTPNTRIVWLVRTLFAGKQREAAPAFGISQAVLSKVVRGEQVVGQRVLAAVAAHPRVSSIWLYNGVGEPLLTEAGEIPLPLALDPPAGEVGPTLPVAGQFLPGHPADFALLLTRKRMPVATPDFAATRFFFEVTGDAPILGAKGEKIASGDCLLMETNRRLWVDHPPVLFGRLLVVRFGGGDVPDLVLARGVPRPERGCLRLDTFGVSKGVVSLVLKASAQGWLSTHPDRPGRAVELDDDPQDLNAPRAADPPATQSPPVTTDSGSGPPSGPVEPRPSKSSRAKEVVVHLDDVVSVCVMLIRA